MGFGYDPKRVKLMCRLKRYLVTDWTEIAKVVSGRTDNAVKNRFSTLCNKRAKHEALSKKNYAYITPNNNMVVFQDGCNAASMSESIEPLKKIRYRIHWGLPTLNNNRI
ncbi:transcription factor MYB88-like [Magnolia sinica]|uniref:transcription factor MYB88-like n=1 Tax=Magnolia sinica TaxID=86752 RepID=UPI00265AFE2A|nr:transcription factor MYB88-like [Magnolia sinica]